MRPSRFVPFLPLILAVQACSSQPEPAPGAGNAGTPATAPGGSGNSTAAGTSGASQDSSAGATNASGSAAGGNLTGGNAGAAQGGATAGSAGNGNSSGASAGSGSGGAAGSYPTLLSLLDRFTAPDVPVRGPNEDAPDPINFNGEVPDRVGDGIAQHPMFYVGENYNRILLVNRGKVIWTYDTQGSWELDDVWLLSNGNVLYSHQTYIEELTPTKQVVWHRDMPGNSEVHTCQPLGLDRVMFGMNQDPNPKIMIVNTKTGAVELEQAMPDGGGLPVHGQLRRMRVTAAGTYVIAWLAKGKVVEYDKDFKPIWTYSTPRPWSVARLHNGNTLLQDENESACKEVDAQGKLVWSLKKSELTIAGANLDGNTQSCERLANGNTVMLIHNPSPGHIQAVEVTRDKQVVWALEDYAHLKDATSAQFLDQPGASDIPGSTEH
jgi:hypothetical protein